MLLHNLAVGIRGVISRRAQSSTLCCCKVPFFSVLSKRRGRGRVPVLLTGRLLVQCFWVARRLGSTGKRGAGVPTHRGWIQTYNPLTELHEWSESQQQEVGQSTAEDGFWRSAIKRWVDKRRFRHLCFLLCITGLTIPAFPAFLPRRAASSAGCKFPATETPLSPFLLSFCF